MSKEKEYSLQELFDAVETASRSAQTTIASNKVYFISNDVVEKLKALAELVNGSPYSLEGSRKVRQNEPFKQYAVVNLMNGPWGAPEGEDEYWLLPGEDPHTYGSIKTAARCVAATLEEEPGQNTMSIRVYRLLPVGIDVVEKELALIEESDSEADLCQS